MSPEVSNQKSGNRIAQQASNVVAEVSHILPDVAERYEAISDELTVLAARHNIERHLEDPATALILTGMAAKLVSTAEADQEDYEAQKEFTDIATGLLTGEIEPYKGELTGAREIEVYLSYKNESLSVQLQKSIQNGLLDGVKTRMGITADNESPFEVHVLDITSGQTLRGIRGWCIRSADGKRYEPTKEDEIQLELINDYKAGLLANGREMSRTLGVVQPPGIAWVSFNEEVSHLFIQNPTAEKILNPDVTQNSPIYDESDHQDELALLEHEYVHTQGTLTLNNNVAFGVGLEELRAEHFSGNRNGYDDIKNFFRDVKYITGLNVPDVFDTRPKGGTAYEMYRDIALHAGIESMTDIIMTAPRNYSNRGAMKTIADYLDQCSQVIRPTPFVNQKINQSYRSRSAEQ